MLKRALVFSTPLSLSLKNEQLVIYSKEDPDMTRTVPIEDIGMVLIENQMTAITIPLLNKLSDNNVAVVFCNQKGMPNSMLLNLDSNCAQGEVLRNQLSASEPLKKQLWKQIIESKIKNQSLLLSKLGKDGGKLKPYYCNVRSGDADNREGAAARLYWSELFGKNFIRDRDAGGANILLNYGYTILRAAVSRALVSSGLFPSLGIFHRGRGNAFPLSDDMMESYRPFVDEIVYGLIQNGKTDLTKETKAALIRILYCDTYFPKVTRPLSVGLSLSMASLAKCYAKDSSKLVFPIIK